MNGAQRAELMDQVKSQLLVATLQELLQVSMHVGISVGNSVV